MKPHQRLIPEIAVATLPHYRHREVFLARSHCLRFNHKRILRPETLVAPGSTSNVSPSPRTRVENRLPLLALPTATKYTAINSIETARGQINDSALSTIEEPSRMRPENPSPSPTAPQSASGVVIVTIRSQCINPNRIAERVAISRTKATRTGLTVMSTETTGHLLKNLVSKDLATVLQQEHNPFSSCAPYLDIFERLPSDSLHLHRLHSPPRFGL